MSTQEFGQWESVLTDAVDLAERSSGSDNAPIRLFIERLGVSRRKAYVLPRQFHQTLIAFKVPRDSAGALFDSATAQSD